MQISNLTLCSFVGTASTWDNAIATVQFILNASLFTLVVVKFARESFQMHRVTGKWQLNKYLHILLREGFLYFLAYVSYFYSG